MLGDLDPYLRLLVVGGGLLAALVLLRLARPVRGTRAGPQTVVGLTPAHALHVVEVDGRRLLVGTGPGGPPRLLMELPSRVSDTPMRDAPRSRGRGGQARQEAGAGLAEAGDERWRGDGV